MQKQVFTGPPLPTAFLQQPNNFASLLSILHFPTPNILTFLALNPGNFFLVFVLLRFSSVFEGCWPLSVLKTVYSSMGS